MKKRIMMLAASLAMLVCLCLGIVACGPTETAKQTFPAPTGVKVDGDVLSWTAVEGASAYTVKINSDETTTVTAASLDLTTVTAKLTAGENTLSVKTNATAQKNASGWSAAVKYTYTPAGPGPDVPEKTAFAAPANVKVEGDTLTWEAVEGAAAYTVKINTDETTAVTGTSLDLTTVTAKLASGENTLSVKANATENKLESAYSASVTYTYKPSAETEASDYKALVDAIGSITEGSTKAQAEAVKAAITAAENKFGGLSEEAKALPDVIEAKASFDSKKTAYEGTMSAAEALHSAFATAVETASETIEAAANLAKLKEDQTAASNAFTALTVLAKSLVTEAEQTAYDAIAPAVAAWTKAIEDEAAKLDAVALPELGDDASAEDIVAKADAALAGYGELPAYVKNDSDVAAKKAEIDDAKADAVARLQATVDALKAEADAALAEEDLKEKYDALVAVQAKAEELGDYAGSLYEETGKAEQVTAVLGSIAKQIVEVQKSETVLFNNDDHDSKARLVIIRKYLNFAGEEIEADTVPTVTASEAVTTEETDTQNNAGGGAIQISDATVVWNETSRAYVITVPFTRLTTENGENAKVVITYKISAPEGVTEEETAVTVGVNGKNLEGLCYDNSHKFYNETTGAFEVTVGNGDEPVYISVYEAADIVTEGNVTYPVDVPLFTATSAELSTLDALKTRMAKEGYLGKTVNVRLLIWQKYDVAEITRYSAINAASYSDAITFIPTQEDLKPRLPRPAEGTVTRSDGSLLLILPANWYQSLAAALEVDEMTEEEVRALIDIRVTLTLGEETKNFTVPMPTSGDTAVSASLMKKNIYTLFGETAGTGEQTYLVLAQLVPKEGTAYTDKLRPSYELSSTRELKVSVSAEDAKLAFNPAVGETPWNLGETPGSGNIQYRWEVLTEDEDLHDGLLIHVYNANGVDDVQTHTFTDEELFVTYQSTKFGDISWEKIIAGIRAAWLKDCKAKIEAGQEGSIVYAYKFVFAMQVVANETAREQGYLDSNLVFATKQVEEKYQREIWEHTFQESDIKATDDAQLNYTKNDNGEFFEFLRSGNGNGYVLKEHGAAYVELKFTKGEESYTAYFFMVYEADHEGDENAKYRLKLYVDADKTGEALDCDSVTNGYTTIESFNTWVRTTYELADFDVRDGWSLQTRVIVNEKSDWLINGEWSEAVTCPEQA